MRERNEHAVVLGGSIAGLLAARVLADVYEQVTVVDRDELLPGSRTRRGAAGPARPRATCARPAGPRAAVPGVDVGARGVRRADRGCPRRRSPAVGRAPSGADQVRAGRVERKPAVARGPASRAGPCSPAGQGCARRRRGRPAVFARRRPDHRSQAAAARRPERRGDPRRRPGRRRHGTRLADAGVADGAGAWPAPGGPAAGGRRRRHPPLPAPTDALDGDLACIHGPTPDSLRGGGLARLEGDIWMLTLFGLLGDHPPKHPEGFDAFANRCSSPTSTRRSAQPSQSTVRWDTGSQPISDAATSGCDGSRRASS